jgi:transposase
VYPYRNQNKLIREKEWTGDTVSNVCKRYGVSRKTYYKWKSSYKQKRIEGQSYISRRPHNTKYKKVIPEVEEMLTQYIIIKEVLPLNRRKSGCIQVAF